MPSASEIHRQHIRDRARTPRVPLCLLLVLAALMATAVVAREPFSVPMPEYLADARQWSTSTPMTDTFTPLAYPLFIAPALHLAGIRGIIALQAMLYVLTVAVAFGILWLLALPLRAAALGSLPILFFPELFTSITKAWDVALSAFLFLFLVLLCLKVQQQGRSRPGTIALGLVFGAAVFCRPNFLLLLPAVAYALRHSLAGDGRSRANASAPPVRPCSSGLFPSSAQAAGVAVLLYLLASILAHGSPFLPANGPYNLYAGNNPLAAQALLDKLNGEPSIDPSLRLLRLVPVPDGAGPEFFHRAELQPIYTRAALTFLFHHPAQEAELTAIKLFTLLRPDTKVHPLRSGAGVGKAILALPAVIFLLALLPGGRPSLAPPDRLLLALEAAYILPFLITNADPRFRVPLDALLMLHAVRLLYLRAGSPRSSQPQASERSGSASA